MHVNFSGLRPTNMLPGTETALLSTDIKAAAPGMHLSDLHADLKSWAAAAPTAGEATVRASASHVISDAFQCRGESLDLSGRGLTSLPDSLGGLTQLKQLNVSDNPLQAFPTKALLTLTSLQTLDVNNRQAWVGFG